MVLRPVTRLIPAVSVGFETLNVRNRWSRANPLGTSSLVACSKPWHQPGLFHTEYPHYRISKEIMDVVSSVRDCLKRWAKGGDSEWWVCLLSFQSIRFNNPSLLVATFLLHHTAIRQILVAWTFWLLPTKLSYMLRSLLGLRRSPLVQLASQNSYNPYL